MEDGRVTMKEAYEALVAMAPAMQQAWEMTTGNDALWQHREELYRSTFIFGKFHWYRKFRVQWLRRQL